MEDEALIENLKIIGISDREARVYLILIKEGPIGGGPLSKKLNIDRTHTYNLLNNLVNKGLASHILKEKKRLFLATSPKNLLNQIQKREITIKSILPSLMSLEKTKKEPAVVQVFEGKEGLRSTVRLMFESKAREFFVYGGTGKSYEILKYEMPHLAKKTRAKKMKGKIITGEKLRGKLFTKMKNIETKYIEKMTPSSTMILGNKTFISIYDEKPFFIIIESKSVADSYRKYFEYLWKQARK